MICSFCGGVAHPATGCVYGPRTIACRACTVEFWKWVREHTNKRGRRSARRDGTTRPEPALTFYEAATVWTNDERPDHPGGRSGRAGGLGWRQAERHLKHPPLSGEKCKCNCDCVTTMFVVEKCERGTDGCREHPGAAKDLDDRQTCGGRPRSSHHLVGGLPRIRIADPRIRIADHEPAPSGKRGWAEVFERVERIANAKVGHAMSRETALAWLAEMNCELRQVSLSEGDFARGWELRYWSPDGDPIDVARWNHRLTVVAVDPLGVAYDLGALAFVTPK